MSLWSLALGLWLAIQPPLPVTGEATYYAQGVMQEVLAYRLRVGDVQACPECVDTVALLYPADIGRKVWLEHPDGAIVGPVLVIDCARRQDVAGLLQRQWVVDISRELARRWGLRGPLRGVTVHYAQPAAVQPSGLLLRAGLAVAV